MDKRLTALQEKSPAKVSFLPTVDTNRNLVSKSPFSEFSGLNRKEDIFPKMRLPESIEKSPKNSMLLPKMVKVSVYTKVTNPYVVIYDSTTKFASPIGYFKLNKCHIVASSDVTNSEEDAVEDRRFRIFPNLSDDVIELQAASKLHRNEWMNFLAPLTQNNESVFTPHKTPHQTALLPTLEEAEEPEELPSDPMKAPPRRKNSRLVRRESLTKIGPRLLRRTSLSKPTVV